MAILKAIFRALWAFGEFWGLLQLLRIVDRALSLGEHVDFVLHYARYLGRAGAVIEYLLEPPPLASLIVAIVAIILVGLDFYYRKTGKGSLWPPFRVWGPTVAALSVTLFLMVWLVPPPDSHPFVPDVFGKWASDAEIDRFKRQGRTLEP